MHEWSELNSIFLVIWLYLSLIQYPHTWYNVPKHKRNRSFTLRSRPVGDTAGGMGSYTFFIPEGYYNSVHVLLYEIVQEGKKAMLSMGNKMRLRYNQITRKIEFSSDHSCTLIVSPHIRKMLGMEESSFQPGQMKSTQVADMDPVDSLYVYCDVLEPRVVGDKQVPLLRIVPAEGDHGQLMTWIYENVHYVRLQWKSFQTNEINIRDCTGNIVPFEQGTWNVTLHFRQRKRLSTLWTWKAEACLCILERLIREVMALVTSWRTFSAMQLPFSNMRVGRRWEQGSLW